MEVRDDLENPLVPPSTPEVSRLYKETWQASNNWLKMNAPHYVLSNIDELVDHFEFHAKNHAAYKKAWNGISKTIDEAQAKIQGPQWWQFWNWFSLDGHEEPLK